MSAMGPSSCNLPKIVSKQSPELISFSAPRQILDFTEEQTPKYVVQIDPSFKEVVSPVELPSLPQAHSHPTRIVETPYPPPTKCFPPSAELEGENLGGCENHRIDESKQATQRILGFKRWVFFLLLAVFIAAVLIGSGIGTAMGIRSRGSRPRIIPSPIFTTQLSLPTLLSRLNIPLTRSANLAGTLFLYKRNRASAPTNNSTASSGPPSTSIIPPPPASTTTPWLWGFQGWENVDFQGRNISSFGEEIFRSFDFNISSYIWTPGPQNCCVTFCQGTDPRGYRCVFREQPRSSSPINRIHKWCDGNWQSHQSEC